MTDRDGLRPRGIIVFVTDQHRADHVGFGGNPDVLTPHLDALAARSLVFDRAHVANPTCMPNRATMVTGRWPSVHGSRTNGLSLDWRANTFVRELRRAGWNTAAIGKLHLQTMGWPFEPYEIDDIRRSQPLQLEPGARDAVIRDLPVGWNEWETFARHADGHVDLPADFYGFDNVDLVVGHGDAPSGHFRHWARARGVDPVAIGGYDNARHRYERWDEIWESEMPLDRHPTGFVRDKAIERLEMMAADDRPFLLFCSFPDPHHPFSPPAPYSRMYDPATLTIPSTFGDTHVGSPPHIQRMVAERGLPRVFAACWSPDEDQFRHALAAEYGLISFIDDAVGDILATVDRLGLGSDTTVMFTSDHGDMFGDHGLFLKHTIHYEAVTRVPLTIASPQTAPGRFAGLVSSADLAPTVLDIAGVGHYRGIQGRSLVDGVRSARSRVIIEEEHLFGVAGLPAPITLRTLLTEEARLTLYSGQPFGELYDLRSDPDELDNRFGKDPDLQGRMTEAMAHELIDLADRGIAPTASA